ncbi:nicotinamide N-methyltransferase-like [Dendropsophus ebraccatus]|uniref:nicotinamide N-methyltransferase-like n=1 Tax=Dendropsophus ebraccatus TaxID=150705 RepID=UPI003831FC54
MEANSFKHYAQHDFDHKQFLQTFSSPAVDPALFELAILFPLKVCIKNVDLVKSLGGTLCDVSLGPNILHLLPFCEYFTDIILLEVNEKCCKELERWLKKEANAVDCAFGAKFIGHLGISSLSLLGKEDILRRKVKSVMIYDLNNENPTKAVVPQKVDCLCNVYVLDHVSEDQESFRRNLKAITSNLRVGGVFISLGTFNTQFYHIEKQKFSSFAYDESFLRKVLEEAGFTIKVLEKQKTKVLSEIIKYDEVWFAAAVKMREV